MNSVKKIGIKERRTKSGRLLLRENRQLFAVPDLLETQKRGFESFINYYLPKLFDELNPIEDLAGERLSLEITDIKVGGPTHDEKTCKVKELTYGGIISGKITLRDNQTGDILMNKRVNIGIMPLMTEGGYFIINGVERVVISQIVRSFGIFFKYDAKTQKYSFKVIPEKGVWPEVFIEKSNVIMVRINKSRKFPLTALLRVMGLESDESMIETFKDSFEGDDINYIEATLNKDPTNDALSAAEYIYSKIRPGEIIDPESAVDYIKSLFLDNDKIYLGRVARRKINAKLGLKKDLDDPASNLFDIDDLVAATKYLVNLANHKRGYFTDDIDHLSNRRVRTLGEVLYDHLVPTFRRFAKSVRGKLSVVDITSGNLKFTDIVNFKMIDNSIKSFFATSQLSQFLDQVNPLAEIEHKRRITALGPGGLKRETATFEVRDVHYSHYGRICPIETPEGQNIGLVIYQALYSRINEEGFIETPGAKVQKEVEARADQLVGRIADFDIKDSKGKMIVKDGDYIDEKAAKKIEKEFKGQKIRVRPFLSGEIEFISPEFDEKYIIADGSLPMDEKMNILQKRVPARHYKDFGIYHVNDISYVDVAPSQIFSVNTSLIPFVDHDDAVRASMGTNMQRQAVPLVKPEASLVGTGLEADIVRVTNDIKLAEDDGEVIYVDGRRIKVKYKKLGTKEYELQNYKRLNQKTVSHERPRVEVGQKVKKGDVLAEGSSVAEGELAIGKNLRVAFMSWEGYNYEDAVIISQRLVKDDELTSVHIEEYEVEVAETKLGPELITNDIPGLSMHKLKNLDENGIVRIGATVKGGDILVGKITPKSEGDLSPEERLIQAIFGDKSKSYKETSLYLPSGDEGKVVDVVVLDAEKGDSLPAGVLKKIKVYVASTRKIEVGDKLAGRHGNKGVIALVAPEEDMPFTSDGKPVDIILNPIGVVSRMNIGQTFETQLGLIAKALGERLAVPLFSDFSAEDLRHLAVKLDLPEDGKMEVYDGRTGEKVDKRVTVGYMYILKLIHMVEDKIHARSVGPYSLITQQPLGGKARDGGQRFGEMEVWALEAYGAVYTLQEMLTIKSDDLIGRNKAYEAIVKGKPIKVTGIPESFNLLVYELKGLLQNILPLQEEDIEKIHKERVEKITKLGLRGLNIRSLEKELEKDLEVSSQEDAKKEILENVLEDLEEYGELE